MIKVRSEPKTFLLKIAYEGTRYFGWQIQNEKSTVQSELRKAIQQVTGQEVTVHGASRTDTGVHALGQAAHVALQTHLSEAELQKAFNAVLPKDIVIYSLRRVENSFHAQFHARQKTYGYWIYNSRIRNPFLRPYAWFIPVPLNVRLMRQASSLLQGEKDFRAFTNEAGKKKNTVRTIFDIRMEKRILPPLFRQGPFFFPRNGSPGGLLWITVSGNGFLYNMVRNIVGSLVEVGREKMDVKRIQNILESRDRTQAGPTAPAHGLWLLDVLYEH